MTPLERALQRQEKHCNEITIIDGVMYCNKSGKIILPMFTKNCENKECDINKCRTLETLQKMKGEEHE